MMTKEPESVLRLQKALQERNYLLGAESELLDRALGILFRMGMERTGWRGFFRRWYYNDEPLRNDAANLVREARFGLACMPQHTRLVGDSE